MFSKKIGRVAFLSERQKLKLKEFLQILRSKNDCGAHLKLRIRRKGIKRRRRSKNDCECLFVRLHLHREDTNTKEDLQGSKHQLVINICSRI